MHQPRYLNALVLFVATTPAMAETAAESWKGSAELGYVTTGGNTETESLNAKAKGEMDRENWRHTLVLEALKSSDQGATTAERYVATAQSNYKLGKSKKNFFFILLSYEEDRFSGYDHRTAEAVGFGRRVLETPTLLLDLEVGPGARQSKLDSGDTENETMVRGAAKLAWKVSDTSDFTEDLSSDVGEEVTITKSVTALTAKVNSSLATRLTYTIKNTSKVPAGFEKTDTETAVTLVYSF
jgi:putative salt-induced outer membrane protein